MLPPEIPAYAGMSGLLVGKFLYELFSAHERFEKFNKGIKSIELLVSVSFTSYDASTPDLSTSWSWTTLKGVLVLRLVSRLDAFSGYPFRT